MSFLTSQINFLQRYFPAYILGFTLGVLLALMKISKSKILNIIASIYIEIVRGTPMLVQIMIVYFGLKKVIPEQFTILTAPMFLCSLSISLNSAAYIAEIIRSGINAIDKGQWEASISLGMKKSLVMEEIILPQATKNILPALANEFIAVIKETSIISTIGVTDIMYNVNLVRGSSYKSLEPLIIGSLLYFAITFTLTRLLKFVEGKYDKN